MVYIVTLYKEYVQLEFIEDSDISIDVKCMEGLQYLKSITNNSIDLVLTDPPYIISRESGMDTH